ncbi:MAG: proline--tRNA ligase [Oscillospiraceae bacterium]|nr:proline--tRNA ligase [Oscillospiraceae bacterium]
MAKGNISLNSITPINEDFGRWYTDVVKNAELIDYSSVRGCVILRPYGYAIWENIQRIMDGMFKETGHENVYMPMFIPESLLQKEKEHVEGFAPEVAWVTHGGSEPLAERLCVRPTSETLFCDHYSRIVHSYRDLPKLYNQWCSVVRWEKSTRPFLRSREFLWQEGHTLHETSEEAVAETMQMLSIYQQVCEEYLRIPVIAGRKTDSEKFAGAESTYTVEAMMHDGRALQSGTSHYFGDMFARAFNIQFADRENKISYPFQTSWGVSTRIIGAIIMTHGDDRGLILPPAIAPTQIVIVPIAEHKEGVMDAVDKLSEELKGSYRVMVDRSDNSPGWKFAQHEMKGVPLRIELGPRDLEQNNCVMVRRDNLSKRVVSLEGIKDEIALEMAAIEDGLFEKALNNRLERTYECADYKTLAEHSKTNGFYKAMWCGSSECEEKLKEQLDISSRCIPFSQTEISFECVCCGKPAKHMVYWGRAY